MSEETKLTEAEIAFLNESIAKAKARRERFVKFFDSTYELKKITLSQKQMFSLASFAMTCWLNGELFEREYSAANPSHEHAKN